MLSPNPELFRKVGSIQVDAHSIDDGHGSWKKAELLTVHDLKEILEVMLPKRLIAEREILKIIEERLMARYSARMSHHRRNG